MGYLEACEVAYCYFNEQLKTRGLATVTENNEKWFFTAGSNSMNRIGNVIISISKETGQMDFVDFLSDEGYEMIKASTPVRIPDEFVADDKSEK